MTEPHYTLAEARAELARRECADHGHSYDVIDNRTIGDSPGQPVAVVCSTCRAHWDIAQSEQTTKEQP